MSMDEEVSYFDIVEAIEKIDSQDIDESVNSVEKIVKKETPANTETPAHSETPVNTETPVNIETPVNTETPVEAVSKCSTLPSGRDKISQDEEDELSESCDTGGSELRDAVLKRLVALVSNRNVEEIEEIDETDYVILRRDSLAEDPMSPDKFSQLKQILEKLYRPRYPSSNLAAPTKTTSTNSGNIVVTVAMRTPDVILNRRVKLNLEYTVSKVLDHLQKRFPSVETDSLEVYMPMHGIFLARYRQLSSYSLDENALLEVMPRSSVPVTRVVEVSIPSERRSTYVPIWPSTTIAGIIQSIDKQPRKSYAHYQLYWPDRKLWLENSATAFSLGISHGVALELRSKIELIDDNLISNIATVAHGPQKKIQLQIHNRITNKRILCNTDLSERISAIINRIFEVEGVNNMASQQQLQPTRRYYPNECGLFYFDTTHNEPIYMDESKSLHEFSSISFSNLILDVKPFHLKANKLTRKLPWLRQLSLVLQQRQQTSNQDHTHRHRNQDRKKQRASVAVLSNSALHSAFTSFKENSSTGFEVPVKKRASVRAQVLQRDPSSDHENDLHNRKLKRRQIVSASIPSTNSIIGSETRPKQRYYATVEVVLPGGVIRRRISFTSTDTGVKLKKALQAGIGICIDDFVIKLPFLNNVVMPDVCLIAKFAQSFNWDITKYDVIQLEPPR